MQINSIIQKSIHKETKFKSGLKKMQNYKNEFINKNELNNENKLKIE